MGLENLLTKAVDMYKNNRIVNINANVLLAAAPSIAVATGVSEVMDNMGCSNQAIVLGAAISDWVAFIPIHVGLHYRTNREQFTYENGEFDRSAFARDVAHVYVTQLPSIGLFYAMAGPLHYYLMAKNIGAVASNQISYWGTMVATRVVHTVIGLKTGLFENNNIPNNGV